MSRRRFWFVVASAAVAIAVMAATFGGALGRSSAQAEPGQSSVGQDIATLQEKVKAFATVGGQGSDIRNLSDLQRAIEAEAARIARGEGGSSGAGRGGPVRPEDVQRLNAKLDLFHALGGNPSTLENVRASLRKAIEAELDQLRRDEGG